MRALRTMLFITTPLKKNRVYRYYGKCKNPKHTPTYVWVSRRNNIPKRCPKCKSLFITVSSFIDKDESSKQASYKSLFI